MPGPYVAAAVFVERVLQELDGVNSLIRVIDRIGLSLSAQVAPGMPAPQLPAEMPEGGQVQVTFVVMLKNGDARGRHPVSIAVLQPSGATIRGPEVDVMFEGGEDRGVNLVLNIGTEAMEGTYWFIVYCDGDRELTRSPLTVTYQRLPGLAVSSGPR